MTQQPNPQEAIAQAEQVAEQYEQPAENMPPQNPQAAPNQPEQYAQHPQPGYPPQGGNYGHQPQPGYPPQNPQAAPQGGNYGHQPQPGYPPQGGNYGHQPQPGYPSPAGYNNVPAAAPAPAVPAQPVEPGEPLTHDDMSSASPADYYFKVDKDGFHIKFQPGEGPANNAAEWASNNIVGKLDFEDVQFLYSMKYERFDPNTGKKKVVYEHSLDRRVSTTGKNWQLCQQEAQQCDQSFKGDYPSAAICLELTEPMVDFGSPSGQGQEILPAGTVVGYQLSTTAWKGFDRFVKRLIKSGQIKKDETTRELVGQVIVEIGKSVVSANGNTWAIPVFTTATDAANAPASESASSPKSKK